MKPPKVYKNEKEVQAAVLQKLKELMFDETVLWYQRLSSFSVRVGKGYLSLCPAGTPDIVCIVNINEVATTVFIEVKRPGREILDYEQKEFFLRFKGIKNVVCVVINHPDQVWEVIKAITPPNEKETGEK